MSRPYEFGDRENRVTSPLDRQSQTQYPPGQAPSFKTNVNRAKTKKWVEAKTFSYEGDDWGDYDAQDEYGIEAAASQAPAPLPQQANATRSFTTPVPAAAQTPGQRRNSFDAGDEKRAFSSSSTFPLPPGGAGTGAGAQEMPPPSTSAQQQPRPGPSQSPVPLHVETTVIPGNSQASAGSSVYPTTGESRQFSATSTDTTNPEHRRDFSPSAMPTPLQTRISPLPGGANQYHSSRFPPRRSSVDQKDAPQPGVATVKSPTEPTPVSPNKALPFIRPADIYKRMEEEREKERKSLESQRQSLDSVRSQEVASPTHSRDPTSPARGFGRRPSLERVAEENRQLRQPPLESVAERKSEYGMPGASQEPNPSGQQSFSGLALPQIGGSSGFGDEFWDSTPLGASSGKKAESTSLSGADLAIQDSALQHQPSLGFRSMVHEAFDAPAIASKQGSLHSQGDTTDSGFSRSNTSGTSDISPIMSRVPSSAAAVAKNAERREATPAIAEEPESLRHSREPSADSTAANFTPGYRRDLRTPSPDNSPARTPAVESNAELPAPEVAKLALASPTEASAAQNLPQPLDATSREADIVEDAKANPTLAATSEKLAQDSFLASQHPEMPEYTSHNIARAESPSKGRVADLAGRFNEPTDARRGSIQSGTSKKSPNSRPSSSSGVKPNSTQDAVVPERPIAEREVSFRPKLPGQYDSYASTASEVPNQVSDTPLPSAPEHSDSKGVDLTPTTSKHKVDGKSIAANAGPMAALAAAGAAIGASLRKSMGSDELEPDSPKSTSRAHGDILNRPLPPDRMESAASTIPPTPPAKDSERQPPVLFKEQSKSPEISAINTSPPFLPAQVTDSSKETTPTDYESDRLRREIVRSLSPEHDRAPAALATESTPTNRAPKRESSAIPSEYDSYWATSHSDEKQVALIEHSTQGIPEVIPEAPPALFAEPRSTAGQDVAKSSSPSPGMLGKRFSWEKDGSGAATTPTVVSPVSGPTSTTAPLQPRSDPLSVNPKLSGEPLHIVNAEPGELPTPVEPTRRLSEEVPPPFPQPATQEFAPFASGLDAQGHSAGPRPPSGPRPWTGEEPRPANFREILGIKSTPARIAKYEETREQFAKMPTGLDNWLSHTLKANPQYSDVATAVHRPPINTATGGMPRHKPTTSINRVFTTKGDGSSSSPQAASASSATYQGIDQRVSVGKGKDILKTAGVLGGKGMKEAKGLFAKGKSKFRGSGSEKDTTRSLPRSPSSSSSISQHRPPSSRRSSRSFSPFRRFSRPQSVIIPNHADIPDLPDNHPSQFDNRPKSYPAAFGTPWAEPDFAAMHKAASNSFDPRSLTPPPPLENRLGVLPSPARSAFTAEVNPPIQMSSPSDKIVESVVRHASPALPPPVEEERTPTQASMNASSDGLLTPRAPNRMSSHQRVVSILQPKDIVIAADDKQDPVSPISPEDEEEGFPSRAPSATEHVVPLATKVDDDVDEAASKAASRTSTDTWEKVSNPGTEPRPVVPESTSITPSHTGSNTPPVNGFRAASLKGSIAHERRSSTLPSSKGSAAPSLKGSSFKGKERAVSPPDTLSIPASTQHSRDPSDTSAVVAQAQVLQFGVGTPLRRASEQPNSIAGKPDRLAEIALAHKRMREQLDDFSSGQPHDFGATEEAGRKWDRHQETLSLRGVAGAPTLGVHTGYHQQRHRSGISEKNRPSPLGPTMTVTEPEPELPVVPPAEVVPTQESVHPSLSVGARSMPSVSSMGHDNNISSEHSPITQDPPVSPIKTSFGNREYHPPNPNRERPMSFVPLPRDPSGLPQQEIISTSKHPIGLDSPRSPQESRGTPSPGAPRRRSKQLSLASSDTEDLYAPPSPRVNRLSQTQLPQRELSLHQPPADASEPRPRPSSGAPGPGISPVQESQQQSPVDQDEEEVRRSSIQATPPQSPGFTVYQPSRPSPPRKAKDPKPLPFHPDAIGQPQHPPQYPFADVATLPVDPPGTKSKKPSVLQKLKGRGASAPEAQNNNAARVNSQYLPPPELRLSSMTSSVKSQDTAADTKRKRGSGFLSGFKRPPSAGAESNRTGASGEASSIMVHSNESPTRQQQGHGGLSFTIPPTPDEDPRLRMGGLKVENKHLQRATTHTGEQPSKKKRFSGFGSLFGRSGTTGHNPKSNKLDKTGPQSTLIHRVPENPNASAFMQMQQQYQNAPPGSQQQRDYLAALQNPERSGIHPPPGGYYAPGNAQENPQFGHNSGTAGFAAIATQQHHTQSPSPATSSNAKDKRSGSNTSLHWPLFGRNSSTASSAHLSPQVSANSPFDNRYQRDSTGAPSISPISSRRDSSPGHGGFGHGGPPRGPGMRMGSISEAGYPGQHQERPWALTLPGADEDDRDITRQEIFHAASARWQRGPDGLMYAIPQDVASPASPHPQAYGTPISPQPPIYGSHKPNSPYPPPPPPPQSPESPENQMFSYLPTQASPPPQQQHSPGHIVNQYQPQYSPHAITTADAQQVVIPPLPQGPVPLMQPQPRRLSQSPIGESSPAAHLPARSVSMQDPRMDPSFRSTGGTAPAPPPKLPIPGFISVSTTSTSTTTTTMTDSPGSANTVIPASASTVTKAPISASTFYSAASPREPKAESPGGPPPPPKDTPTQPHLPALIIPSGGPVGGSGIIGPDAMGSSTRSMQTAMMHQQQHARNASRDSDDEPVMKAVSYPGDEWMPRWDID